MSWSRIQVIKNVYKFEIALNKYNKNNYILCV